MANPSPHTEALAFVAATTAALSGGATHDNHVIGITFTAGAQWAEVRAVDGAGTARPLERYTSTGATDSHAFTAAGPFPYGFVVEVSAAGAGITGRHDWAESWLKGRC